MIILGSTDPIVYTLPVLSSPAEDYQLEGLTKVNNPVGKL